MIPHPEVFRVTLKEEIPSRPASVNLEYPYSLPGSKRPYVALGDDPLYSDPRVRPRTHLESSFPVASPGYTAISQGVGMTSLSYHERQGARYTSGYAYLDLPTGFQWCTASLELIQNPLGIIAEKVKGKVNGKRGLGLSS
ncbi:hypothetical protein CK203_100003 [Vitis vinifera]|uniref:Uncharacterized protein n=1 Tax=Vitis vinifera TaxID=29760 RepID=A0A438DI91_VITVI|nr:hypothetical protein CK203_100003 [Vitis vinifera]